MNIACLLTPLRYLVSRRDSSVSPNILLLMPRG